jgi:dephospho-CoA kinase
VRIGLTGLIGSGKTEVARVFKSLGAEIISGDDLGREAVETDKELLGDLTAEFGKDILREDGTLDRRALGKVAFSNPENTEKLNTLVHPVLLKLLDMRLEKGGHHSHTVVDAALLVYWGYHKKMDVTVLVTSSWANRRERLLAAGYSEEEIENRSHSQLPEETLREATDIILPNDGSLADLQRRARELFLRLTEKG